MRAFIIFLSAIIALTGSLSAVFATEAARDYELRGYVDATSDSNLPYRLPRLGVNVDLFQYDETELRQNLSWMQEANVSWLRQFLYWDELEPEQGEFDWQDWDNLMAVLADYPDLQLVVVIMNSPTWARENEIVSAPPDDPNMISPFLREFVARYGEEIDFYQIWDEPNLDDAWGLTEPRPAEYAALLSVAYEAIHGLDGDATVMTAGLAPTKERGGMNIADILYLESLYELGAEAYFDAVAAKPYGFDSSPLERTVNIDTLNFSRMIALREIMLKYGDAQTALWASNWGWNSLPDDWAGSDSIWGQVSEETRIDYTLSALERAEREWPWLGGMILQTWQPNLPDDNPQWGFALVGQDNQPNSLWEALSNRSELEAASNGLYHPRSEFSAYSGIWTFSDLGADIGWLETSDSQAEFDFYGSDIALLLREGNYFAFLYPSVDGKTANATAHDADDNAYILLRSADQSQENSLVMVSERLDLAPHRLRLIPDRGWDRWALAGYAVSSGNLAQPYNQQIAIAWFSAFAAAIASLVSGYFLPWAKIAKKLDAIISGLNAVSQVTISFLTSLALMFGMLLTWGTGESHIFRRDLVENLALLIITGGLLAVELHFILVIVAVLLLFVLIYRHLETGILLIILYAPFFLFPVELYRFGFPMSEMLLLITTGAWLLRLFAQWGRERQSANSDYPLAITIRWNVFDALMLSLGFLAILALFFSERLDPALTEFRTLFLEPLVFYAIIRTIQPTKAQLMRFVYALIGSGLLVSVIGLLMYAMGRGIITAEAGSQRLASVYGSPNNVGLFLGRCIPFALAFLLVSRAKLVKLIMGGILLVMLVTIALTQSVGAIVIGVPVGIATVILLVYRQKAILPLTILGILGLIAVFTLSQVSPRFASLLDISTGTGFIRLRVWESSLEILRGKPFTGLGLDQFLYEFSGTYVRPDAINDPDLSHPHNIFLDFWIRLGALGLIWLLAYLIVFWRSAIKQWKSLHNEGSSILIIGTIGAMAAVLAHGLIDNSVFVLDLVYVFMLLTIFCGAEKDLSHENVQKLVR